MKDISTLTADAILAIPETQPERLFTGEVDMLKREYRELAKRWHPDYGGVADVLARLNVLYDLGLKRLAEGTWMPVGTVVFKPISGKTVRIRYQAKRDFELGTLYVSRTLVTFAVRKSEADLLDNARAMLAALRFPSAAKEEEFKRCLPKVKTVLETDDAMVLVLEKTPDVLLLRDVLAQQGGRMDPKAVAWILSSLCNIACFLEWNGISHNALTLDTCFISPQHHTVLPLGGWFYARKVGEKLLALPDESVARAPAEVLDKKVGTVKTDLEMIRALGRELLGDLAGARLGRDPAVPKTVSDWLRFPSAGEARSDYAAWEKARDAGFGARRFTPLAVSDKDLYPDAVF